jgi:threonine/homoserine/homoserine lactone efflux protein
VSLIAIFARALGIGILIAAPVGPLALLCMQRTLTHGRARGYATGAGVATGDAVYASIAAFGLTVLTGALVSIQPWVRVIGGAALVYLGVRAMRVRPVHCASEGSRAPLLGQYTSAFALTLANPQTILSFAAVFAGAGLAVSGGGWASPAVTVAGVFAGSLLWWVIVVSIVGVVRAHSGEQLLLWAGRLSGAAIIVLGLVAEYAGLVSIIR